MKKIVILTLIIGMTSNMNIFAEFDQNKLPIQVFLQDKPLAFDFEEKPIIEGNRVLVPLRSVMEGLGVQVFWDGKTKTVNAKKEGKEVTLQVGNKKAKVNGKIITLDVPPKIMSNRTFVPLRFISEALGAKVEWDAWRRNVLINSSLTGSPFLGKFEKVSREKVALSTIPIVNSSNIQLNKRLYQLLVDMGKDKNMLYQKYNDNDYKNGIIIQNNCIILSDRFSENIFNGYKIGDTIESLKDVLGTPAYKDQDAEISVFQTSDGLMITIEGKDIIKNIALFQKDKPKNSLDMDVIKNILISILRDPEGDLREGLNKDQGYYDDWPDRYEHPSGIFIQKNNAYEELKWDLQIYADFTGNLYRLKSGGQDSSIKLTFVNEPINARKGMMALLDFKEAESDFKSSTVKSPGNKYSVRDFSYFVPAMRSTQYALEIKHMNNEHVNFIFDGTDPIWLDAENLLYIHEYYGFKGAINIVHLPSKMMQTVFDDHMAGVNAIYGGDLESITVKDTIITIQYQKDGIKKTKKLGYSTKQDGQIKTYLLN